MIRKQYEIMDIFGFVTTH